MAGEEEKRPRELLPAARGPVGQAGEPEVFIEPETPSPNAVLVALDLVKIHWEAEEENARRINTRTGFLVTLTSALLGLAIVGAGRIAKFSPDWAYAAFQIAIASAIAFLLASLWVVLRPAMKARRLASQGFLWPVRSVAPPWEITAEQGNEIVLGRISAAARALLVANARKEVDINRAQALLLVGASAAAVAILVYSIWGAQGAPKAQSEQATHSEQAIPGEQGPAGAGDREEDRQELPIQENRRGN